jgi:hypothetical protein
MGTILELENSATNLFCLLSFSCGFPGALFISHLILSFCLQVEKVKQDDGLNDLSNLLVELKGMAVDMGTEMGRLVMLIQLHWSIWFLAIFFEKKKKNTKQSGEGCYVLETVNFCIIFCLFVTWTDLTTFLVLIAARTRLWIISMMMLMCWASV